MKTKNLLFLILILGFSFNSFSQEEVTIKQVLKNSSKSTIKIANDQINYVRVNTSIPVTINKGKENAIYITGEFDGAEDYAGFCTLEDAILKINNPKKGKRITLELANDVNMFYFGNNANVSINKDINVESNGIFGAENNSVAMINSKITGKDLMIRSRNNSKISFYSINVDKLDVKAEKGSEVILNGKTNTLKLDKDEDSKFIKDTFSYSSLYEALELNEDDTILAKGNKIYLKTQEFVSRPKHKRDTLKIDKEGNIINSKGDTITKAEKKDAEVSKVTKVIEGMGESGETKIWSPYPKLNVVLAASVGGLNWSDRVSKVDDLFSSPSNEYDLKGSMSYNIGLSLRYKLNKKIQFSTGLLFESNQFKFKNNVMMTNINGEKRLAYETNPAIDATSYLSALYINIPLGFQYNFYKDLSLNFSGIFGINFRNSSTGFQRTYDVPNMEITERWGTNYNNFKPIKFEVQAGIGWLGLDLYVKYALTPLFKDNKERELYPFSVGLSTGI
ncbi:MAG: outer membrane beta-barrel protein [Bacteroidales bacterium]|nr:outer membrane beta-barrel protein [Bacteroidales bacterium]